MRKDVYTCDCCGTEHEYEEMLILALNRSDAELTIFRNGEMIVTAKSHGGYSAVLHFCNEDCFARYVRNSCPKKEQL